MDFRLHYAIKQPNCKPTIFRCVDFNDKLQFEIYLQRSKQNSIVESLSLSKKLLLSLLSNKILILVDNLRSLYLYINWFNPSICILV